VPEAVARTDRYPSGALRSVVFCRETVLDTPSGPLTPVWNYEDARRKYAPGAAFYESGALKSVRLQEPAPIPCPLGKSVPAERVSYYESGAVRRLFPLDGRISGFWSERDERALLRETALCLSWGHATLAASCLAFYESGELRSVTLWPGAEASVPLPGGGGWIRPSTGFSLYRDGRLASVEPARPVTVATPIGPLPAHDPEAVRVCADSNSLQFDGQGAVRALKSLIILKMTTPGGVRLVSPVSRPHPLDDARRIHLPLSLAFPGGFFTVSRGIRGEGPSAFPLDAPVELVPYVAHRLVRVIPS
jgi:hypothetical protein